jgi:hypothetical protein
MSNKKDDNSKKEESDNEPETEPSPPSDEKSKETSEENEIAQIKSDVNQLSDNLQTTVTELKKSIVDIRSAVSEIENPFNLLRTISSEKDVKKLNGERLPEGVKTLILGRPQENGAAGNAIKENREAPEPENIEPACSPEPQPKPPTQPKKENPEETPKTEAPSVAEQRPPKISSAYLDWIWDLLEVGLKAADIQQLACSCECMGYLPAQSSEFLYSLAVAAELVRKKGLTKAHLILNLYKAAAISKAAVGWEDMDALIAIAEEDLKKLKTAKRDD